ncbi:hypothetical protein J2S70_001027 [Trueperella bonasi]|uniref:YtxH domain-containing protein n=1 Tax=Trueperella bonasi TaxID=312286 RepID=A0ABT9NGX5_9ACTO|nr:hypothetical protein [Trueperella bonasi]MDP9806445.1 hypothetical protein [Trueperella bonasi]
MGFLKTLTVGAIGYVLGARAGRERYEQIKTNAQKLWNSGTVREGRSKVRNQAAETFQQAQDVAAVKFQEAAEAVKDKVNSDDDEIHVEAVHVPSDGRS